MNRALFHPATVLFLSCIAVSASGAPNGRADPLGAPAPSPAAKRTVTVHADTRYVNVVGGDVVRFMVDGKPFIWRFGSAAGYRSFDLNEVAPSGLLSHRVVVHVSPSPRPMRAETESPSQ